MGSRTRAAMKQGNIMTDNSLLAASIHYGAAPTTIAATILGYLPTVIGTLASLTLLIFYAIQIYKSWKLSRQPVEKPISRTAQKPVKRRRKK